MYGSTYNPSTGHYEPNVSVNSRGESVKVEQNSSGQYCVTRNGQIVSGGGLTSDYGHALRTYYANGGRD